MDGAGWQRLQRFRRCAVQRSHGTYRLLRQRGLRAIEFDRRADDAGAERFGEEEDVARLRAGVRQHARRIDRAGHGISELDFLIPDRMTAEQRHARLAQFVEPAAENRADRAMIEALCWKRPDGERCQRSPTHRVDVADRVRRGNLAVHVRVVDNRREKVDGLHQRRSALPPEDTRIVRGPEVDKDTVVGLRGDVTQHLSELASGEFARSTGAGDHLRQALGHASPPVPSPYRCFHLSVATPRSAADRGQSNTEERSNGDERRRPRQTRSELRAAIAVRRASRSDARDRIERIREPGCVPIGFVYPFESGHASRPATQAGPSNRSPPSVSVTPFLRVKTVTSVISARSGQRAVICTT